MKKFCVTLVLLLFSVFAMHAQSLLKPDTVKAESGEIIIQPIRHATMVLNWQDATLYVDPAQREAMFSGLPSPDIILITDVHGDHFNPETLDALNTENATIVVPQAVADRLSTTKYMEKLVILDNGEQTKQMDIPIRAIPMYNLPQSEDARHPKGRGNGYVLTLGGENLYLSGDTEGIPEMRNLENIDIAFVCMNMPYTMSVKQAAEAVLDFQPDIVYPYHYRGQDAQKFRKLVNTKNADIEVRLRDWYVADN